MDIFGQILFYLVLVAPIITLVAAWKYLPGAPKLLRVVVGLMLGLFVSFTLFGISMAICFRDGMGPV